MDERRESGEWYPGGRDGTRPSQDGGGGEGDAVPRVPVTPVSELPENYRDSDMRNKINELARIVSGNVG